MVNQVVQEYTSQIQNYKYQHLEVYQKGVKRHASIMSVVDNVNDTVPGENAVQYKEQERRRSDEVVQHQCVNTHNKAVIMALFLGFAVFNDPNALYGGC